MLTGVPTDRFTYRGDSETYDLDIAATRYLRKTGDLPEIPLALVPYFARSSSVTASGGLSLINRDSLGTSRRDGELLQSSLSGNLNVRRVGLSGTWYVRRMTSLRLGGRYEWARATDTTTSLSYGRTTGDLVAPPGSATFERRTEATDRLPIAGALRF